MISASVSCHVFAMSYRQLSTNSAAALSVSDGPPGSIVKSTCRISIWIANRIAPTVSSFSDIW